MKSKRTVLVLGLLALMACGKKTPPAPTVYIQEGDTFYHRAKCECLSGREVAYQEADVKERGYKPCVICMVTNTILDPTFQKSALKEQEAREEAEMKASEERARKREAQRQASRDLENRKAEESRIAAEEQRLLLEEQQQEEARLQFNQSISQNRRARESEKHGALNNVRTLTSDDAYRESLRHGAVQWNGGGVVWQQPINRVP